ncbi:hypothetical protein [Flavobacterium pedocola]
MRRIILFFALISGMLMTQSCVREEVVHEDVIDNDTISEVWEYTNVDFHPGNGYSVLLDFPHATYTSDMVLVYHLYEVSGGQDVWRLMPQTYYFSAGGELDYNFDFTTTDARVFLDANFDLNTLSSAWTDNQIFRVVVIPAYFGNKNAKEVDLNNYNEVIKHFNIDESKIVKIAK